MAISIKHFLKLLLVFLIIVLLVVWYKLHHKPAQKSADIPTMIAQQMQTMSFNPRGQLSQQSYSPHVKNFSDQQRSEFLMPIFFSYSANAMPWKITADKAIALKNFSRLELAPNVRIYQAAGKHNKATVLTTAQLTVFPKHHTARNTVLTTAVQPGLTVQSMGVYVNMKQGKVVLLKQATGDYFSSDNGK